MTEDRMNFLIAVAESCGSVTLSGAEFLQLVKERDALLKFLKEIGECECCKFNDDEHLNNGYCKECSVGKSTRNGWEWMGIQE